LGEAKDNLGHELAAATGEVTTLNTTNTNLQSQVTRTTANIKVLLNANNRSSANALGVKLAGYQADLKQAQADLETAKHSADALRETFNALEAKTAAAQHRIHQLEADERSANAKERAVSAVK